ncbi:hypothetical protein ACXJJ3_32680 [Kribbella sp. WER1]
MSNPNKEKGTRWETAVERFLLDNGIKAYKPRQAGFLDKGDIIASPFTLQAKDWRDVTSALREGVAGAQVQKVNSGEPFAAAVVKRARKPVEESYLVMRLADLPELIRALAASND